MPTNTVVAPDAFTAMWMSIADFVPRFLAFLVVRNRKGQRRRVAVPRCYPQSVTSGMVVPEGDDSDNLARSSQRWPAQVTAE